ncbi:hypothetical protein DL93DRAFT_278069 [Clavulina sp. PMI_390]|nr:hypothetical protein DL93DRAFT_278069 [Clavulina sp. PMI_390]
MLESMIQLYWRTSKPERPFTARDDSQFHYNCLERPPPGYAHTASTPLVASTQAFSILLQAMLNHDPRLLSKELWAIAEGDALAGTNIKIPVPRVPSVIPQMAPELKYFATPEDPNLANTMNLLNTELTLGPTTAGRPSGSYGWTGFYNSWYAIDPINGFGYMWSAQCGPWASPEILSLRDDFEKLLYRTLSE